MWAGSQEAPAPALPSFATAAAELPSLAVIHDASDPSARLPPGSDWIADFARRRGLAFDHRPDEAWFRRWEPYDTIAPPSRYFNACTQTRSPGHIVVVEPWYAEDDGEPLGRALLAFATHPGLKRRAAMRVGEHFLTRVAFIESPPPPTVTVGDKLWDAHATTFAASSLEAATAFHPRLRKLLAGWGFKGHIELRAGGAVIHYAELQPRPDHYDRMFAIAQEIVSYAVAYPR